jgi:hypothetical protein
MDQEVVLQHQQTYIPAIAIRRATLKHSWGRLPVATLSEPKAVCGEARRIGYTGKGDSDLALYRLKIKQADHRPTMTLPELYIIDEGRFLDYDLWQRTQQDRRS